MSHDPDLPEDVLEDTSPDASMQLRGLLEDLRDGNITYQQFSLHRDSLLERALGHDAVAESRWEYMIGFREGLGEQAGTKEERDLIIAKKCLARGMSTMETSLFTGIDEKKIEAMLEAAPEASAAGLRIHLAKEDEGH